ncbi:phytochrome-like protein cph2 [Clostridium homopropionicum DSM 5847]|uniref:Phytochrome-like protein cph2 n=1 Tax=Clostridium homopropionicum DSM 5847 TaxID=1121318 RepID=A0A0L6ZEQ1_9CLOT|nr:EAL domain-containing protein [Clostridium homopropionicum]KOA21455.1 phytochrome-like protein cph2 [Clostridium homopropionicum DSM 5847]SFG09217.1 diguanylate cyclase (GGDEF) domain-containing protein [Clostridium homopropionicum]
MVFSEKKHNIKFIGIFILLTLLGIMGNYLEIKLLKGLDFIFGSIFVLLISYFYGLRWSFFASLIVSSYTYYLWNHPFGVILYTLEIVFIAVIQKRKIGNIILLDSVFWILIGMPLTILIYNKVLNLNTYDSYIIALNKGVNGILNVFLANLLLMFIKIRNYYANNKRSITLPLNQILFTLFLGTVIMSDLFISIYNNGLDNERLRSLSIILISIISTLLIATLFSKVITYPIRKLAKETTRLPSKILNEDSIEWPRSIIKEIDTLIMNFKSTSKILKENFKEIQNANDELEYLANHDFLTRLPNRFKFNRELNDALLKSEEDGSELAVLFLDLDRFKLINDTFGHDIGDKLLLEISNRLVSILRKDDVVCRIGGDEFNILLSNIKNREQVSKMAEAIVNLFKETYIIDGQEFSISTSIGIAISIFDGKDLDLLLKKADIAMYKAKEKGKNNFLFYQKEMNMHSVERFKLENRLRKALEQEEFILYYQPRVDANSDKIIAVEALIRWNNPELGMVSPAEFIPLAEESGLIVPIGEWVLRTACMQNKQWQDAGHKPIRVSVNLSAMQFIQQDLVDKIGAILDESGLSSEWLELEITEGIIIKDLKGTMETLGKLKEMGVHVSLDDFGTGFSSLNYLKNFKIDTLKIDASFVRDISDDKKNTAIVNTIIMLGKNLDLNVTAEGVETETQLEFLKNKGCNEIQGFLYSKPVPPEECEKLIYGEKILFAM